MTTAIQRGVSLVMGGVIIGAFAVWFLVWWWLGPRR